MACHITQEAIEEKSKKIMEKVKRRYEKNLKMPFSIEILEGVTTMSFPFYDIYRECVLRYCASKGVEMIYQREHISQDEIKASVVTVCRASLTDTFTPLQLATSPVTVDGVEISEITYVGEDAKCHKVDRCGLRIKAKSTVDLKLFMKRILAMNSPSPSKTLEIYSISADGLYSQTDCASKRILERSALSVEQSELATRLSAIFAESSRKKFAKDGIVVRHNILLCGLPGSGKSQFAQYVAQVVNRKMYRVNVLTVKVIETVRAISTSSVIVFEDADTLCQSRNTLEKDNEPSNKLLGSLLSLLDGTRAQHLFILTTNYPQKLDVALSRAGRIATKMSFGWIPKVQIVEVCKAYFPAPELYETIAKQLEKISHLTISMVANFCQIAYFRRFIDPKHQPSAEDYATLRKDAQQFEEKWQANAIVDKPTVMYM
jgi:hypothetical protein